MTRNCYCGSVARGNAKNSSSAIPLPDLCDYHSFAWARKSSQRSSIGVDLGIAKVLDGPARKTTVGMVLGTPLYMSPEQCEGRDDLSPKADVYAIGVLMFEMLAGRLPFTAESSAAMMRQHLFKSPPELAALVPQIPQQLGTLVGRMLSKSPESRPPIAEVVPELERLLPHVLDRTESLVQGLSLSAPTRVERVPLTQDPEQTPLRPQPAHRLEALPVDSTLAVQVGTTLKQPQVVHSPRRWATIVSAAIVALLVIGAGYFGVSALTSAKAPARSQVTPRVQPPRSGAEVVVPQPIVPKDLPTVAAPASAPVVKHEEGRPSKRGGKGSDSARSPRAKAASGNQMARWEVD